jgi:hypothetical protein
VAEVVVCHPPEVAAPEGNGVLGGLVGKEASVLVTMVPSTVVPRPASSNSTRVCSTNNSDAFFDLKWMNPTPGVVHQSKYVGFSRSPKAAMQLAW